MSRAQPRSKLTILTASALSLAAAAALPVVLAAPRAERANPEGVRTLDDTVHRCRASALRGWDLVSFATDLVNRKFTRYSAWHLWESPSLAFLNSRGQSNQYNLALATVLKRLDFEVQVVHAARARKSYPNPWFHTGHTWLRVTHQGRTLDVCASDSANRPGQVTFTPVTPARPWRPWAGPAISVALLPFVTGQVWRQWVNGEEVAGWLFRDFDPAGSRLDRFPS